MDRIQDKMTRVAIDAATVCAESPNNGAGALLSLILTTFHSGAGAIYLSSSASNPTRIVGDHDDELLGAAIQFLSPAINISSETPNLTSCVSFPSNAHVEQCAVLVLRFDNPKDLATFRRFEKALVPYLRIAVQQDSLSAKARQVRESADRQFADISLIHQISQAVDKSREDEFLDVITEKALDVMDGDVAVLIIEPHHDIPRFVASTSGDPLIAEEFTKNLDDLGLIRRVATVPEPILVTSMAPLSHEIASRTGDHMPSALLAPIHDADGIVQGILSIRRPASKVPFGDRELKLLDLFTSQATLGINNRSLHARLNKKLRELSTLSSLTESLISTRDIDTLLNEVADSIADVVHFDACRIYISDPETGRLSVRIVRGFETSDSTRVEDEISLGEGVIGQVAQSLTPILVRTLDNSSPAIRNVADSLGVQSFYIQPIVARGKCIGVVVVSDKLFNRSITESRIELLSTFVHHAAIAIENAQYYKIQERRYAELTTLYEISRRLASTSGVKRAAQTIAEIATTITRSNSALLLLFNSKRETLRQLHSEGLNSLTQSVLNYLPQSVRPKARSCRQPRILLESAIGDLFGEEWKALFDPILDANQSVALVPLVVDDQPIGFLVLGKRDQDFQDEELRLIAVASSQAAAVLQSAWNYDRRIGLHELELTAVYELMQKVRTAATQDEALKTILDLVAVLVPCDSYLLLTLNYPPVTMSIRAARGSFTMDLVGAESVPVEGIIARALRERTGLISSDPSTDTAGTFDRYRLHNPESVRSLIAVPLAAGEEIIGILLLESNIPDIFSEESVRVLHLVASQAATIFQEISSLRALTQYTDNILRSIAAGVITADKNGTVVTWNPRVEEILGVSSTEIGGKTYADVFSKVHMDMQVRDDTLRMLDLTAHTGKVFSRNQLRFQTKRGDDSCINLTATQLKSISGEYLGIVIVVEDVTRAAQMKDEVERVRRLAETGQLAANIAHELRNPLSSIKGAAQLLRNEFPPEFVAQHGEFLDIIIDEANGLNRITTEFLEFSRVVPPVMKLEDINQLISRLLQFMGTYIKEQSVMVCLDFDETMPPIYMDRSQVEQVIKNIVINGIQAMPLGGALTIKTRYNRDVDLAEMSFKDSGIGIAADKLDKIWMPFFTTKTKGTGLGLPIARKIAETHGGVLSVESNLGEGSNFVFTVPVHPIFAAVTSNKAAEIADQRSHSPRGGYERTSRNSVLRQPNGDNSPPQAGR